jgi:hypothetical protein
MVHGTRETSIPDSLMKPPVELLLVAPDRYHASFQMDGPSYVKISTWLFPMVNLVQLWSDLMADRISE